MLIQLFCFIFFFFTCQLCLSSLPHVHPIPYSFMPTLFPLLCDHSNAMPSMMQLFLFQYVLNYLHPFHQTHGPSGQSSNLHYHAMLSVTQESPVQCLSLPSTECTAFLFTCMHTHARTPYSFQPASNDVVTQQ